MKNKKETTKTLPITKIQVIIQKHFADRVTIYTSLPSPMPNAGCVDNLSLTFDVEKDHGVEYVKKIFGVNPKIIDFD